MGNLLIHFNVWLLFLSVIIGYGASLTAIMLVRQANQAAGHYQMYWVIASGLVLGAGIWSMQFVGILSMDWMVYVTFSGALILMSLFVSLFAAFTAMTCSVAAFSGKRVVFSAVFCCFGITSLHFIVMASMELKGAVSTNSTQIIISLFLSFIFSYLCFKQYPRVQEKPYKVFLCALYLAAANWSMHYAAMHGTHVQTDATNRFSDTGMEPNTLALYIGLSMIILFAGSGAALFIAKFIYTHKSALSESRRLLEELFLNTMDGLIVMNVREPFEIVKINTAMLNRLGYTGEEVIGKSFLELSPEGSVEALRHLLCNAFKGTEGQIEIEHITQQGERLYSQVSVRLVYVKECPAFVAFVRDVTAAKRLEFLLITKKRIFIMIARDYPIKETLEMICRAVEEQTLGSVCSISLIDEEGGKLWVAAGNKLSRDYKQAINGLTVSEGRGSCGTAIWRNEIVITPDIQSSPLWDGYSEAAQREGYRCCYSSPIRSGCGNKVYGALAVYLREPRHPNAYDLQIIEKMAYLAGLALERNGFKNLKRNVELYKLISEHATDLIWWVDESDMIQYTSPSLCLFEILAEKATGSLIWNFIDPRDLDSMKAAIYTSKVSQVNQVSEFRLIIEGRCNYILEASIIPFINGDGNAASVLIVAKDVTARKEAERRLDESRQNFRSLYYNHPAAIYSFDLTGRFTCANGAAEEITGYSFSELDGHTFDFLIKEEDLAYTREMFNKAVQGHSGTYEARLLHKDGHYVHLSVTNLPIIINCKIVGVHGISHDITDRKHLEEELTRARIELEDTMRYQDGLLFKIRKNGDQIIFTTAGGNMLEKLGFTPEDICGVSWEEVFSDQSLTAEVRGYFRRVWEGEERVRFITDLKGTEHSFLLNPVVKYGKVVEIVGICLVTAGLIIEEDQGDISSSSQDGKQELNVMHPVAETETSSSESHQEQYRNKWAFEKLTKREWEVAEQIVCGRSNKEIAMELQISENTVKNHVANIFNKLNMGGRSQIAELLRSEIDKQEKIYTN